ncbi:MAG TPA: phytanoyl-CoA dioxygenase family protein [Candidatus Binataceae bacterium]|nr:phytanoyl-CoA dioxygenase family protein [Candidatus Binataceae bacterium]
MSELDEIKVYGETDVGWCALTLPNESVDDTGRPFVREKGFSAADPRAPKRRDYDDPEVRALREHLRTHNGIRGLEMLEPHEIERAAQIFFRDGFVVVKDVINADELERWRAASAKVLKQILQIPGVGGRKYLTESYRLPHRYSYGTASASRHLLHDPVWASMIDLPSTTLILTRIFGGPDYRVLGAGGDLCLPGAIEYQALHSDGDREHFQMPPPRVEQARRLGVKAHLDDGTEEQASRTLQLTIERTPPVVTVNFLMTDATWENGPIRQIPGTQGRPGHPPVPADEPEWMRLSTLAGAPAGAAIFRDTRAWHGGTPNLSREIRAMPNVEYMAPWYEDQNFQPAMPYEIWAGLSPHAQRISLLTRLPPGEWPAGAGVMHPLANERRTAKASRGKLPRV